MLTEEQMYKALIERDATFEGSFYAAVKTTGIFCRPVCSARKPKKENIEYFLTAQEALANGYRPCKKCKPLKFLGDTPDYIINLIDQISNNPSTKITNYGLITQKIEPNKVRRWFKLNYGITFSGFQRMLRLNIAYRLLAEGADVSNAAYNSGYNSISGFSDAYKKIIGSNPTSAKSANLIYIKRITTPIGPMLIGATDQGLCLLEFTDRRMLPRELKELKKYFSASLVYGNNGFIQQTEKEIEEYFNGKRLEFSTQLNAPGTPFQKNAWEKLLAIPYGETRSYKQQAEAVHNPSAVRAIAKANGANRISIIIPCHRVIGNDGALTGYGGGVWRKKWLLDFEMKNK